MKIVYILLASIFTITVAVVGAILIMPSDNEVNINLLSDPNPMTIGPIDLMVSVTDGRGRPIEDADVYVTTQYTYDAPLNYSARRYENGYYHIPVTLTLIGQITITANVDLANGEMFSEEYVTFVYSNSGLDFENQPYRSEREIEEELANIPDNEYWIVVPHGAQEISGMYFKEFVPSFISLSVSGKNTLVIRNDDFVENTIGPFTVRAGETLRQRFDKPGLFVGTCTINQGLIRIEVTN